MQKVYFRKVGDWLGGEMETQWDAHAALLCEPPNNSS